MADVLYWIVGTQAFGYTPHRQADGKFYAIKYRYDPKTKQGTAIKKRAFARRKKAKETAYHWYQQRKAALERLKAAKPKKPIPTRAEIIKKKIEKCEAKIRRHTTRMKVTENLIKKWKRKKKYYEKQLKSVSPTEITTECQWCGHKFRDGVDGKFAEFCPKCNCSIR